MRVGQSQIKPLELSGRSSPPPQSPTKQSGESLDVFVGSAPPKAPDAERVVRNFSDLHELAEATDITSESLLKTYVDDFEKRGSCFEIPLILNGDEPITRVIDRDNAALLAVILNKKISKKAPSVEQIGPVPESKIITLDLNKSAFREPAMLSVLSGYASGKKECQNVQKVLYLYSGRMHPELNKNLPRFS